MSLDNILEIKTTCVGSWMTGRQEWEDASLYTYVFSFGTLVLCKFIIISVNTTEI